ncbi:MAG: DUF7471 family protein, partial [Nitrososphaerales archaeon]
MLPVASYYDDVVQVALTAVSAVLMVISVNAYRRRRDGRYLLLMLAFVLLCVGSASTTIMELFVGAGPATVQLIELYLNPSVELLMGVSFLVALLWSSKARRRAGLVFAATIIAVAVVASAAYVSSTGASALLPLPAGCVRPADGFLIVGSSLGYNDSIVHGAPVKPWPILDVANGSDVAITVCNTYAQPLGFQVAHYLDDKIEAIDPGQALTVSFVADETGTFLIYCSVLSPIHVYLQG